jgi:hypothetical protein
LVAGDRIFPVLVGLSWANVLFNEEISLLPKIKRECPLGGITYGRKYVSYRANVGLPFRGTHAGSFCACGWDYSWPIIWIKASAETAW